MLDIKEILKNELRRKKEEGAFVILNEENSLALLHSIFQEFIDSGKINIGTKKPGEVIFLEAPTGSGKDNIFLQIVKENPEKNYIELNMDMFRKYYYLFMPNKEEISDLDYVKLTNQFTYEIFIILQEVLLKYFPGTNIVISGSLRETDWNEKLMRIYKQNGYKVKLTTVTVSRKEGHYSIIKRYVEMVDRKRSNPNFKKGTARYTSFEYFDETYEKFIENFTYFMNLYYASPGKLIDTIEVYRRNNSLIDFKDDNLMYSTDTNKDKTPLEVINELRDINYILDEREIGYIFTLIGKNREYFEEQGTLKDLLFTLVYLISTNFLSEDKKRTI